MSAPAVVDIADDINRPEWQATRLAEFVFHLTDCSADDALVAVSNPSTEEKLDNDQALARVAAAIVALRH